MKTSRINARSLLSAVMTATVLLLWAAGAQAQTAYISQNAYSFGGRQLTGGMVRDELERRMALNPKNEAAVWNAGYDFYRGFPHNQDTARAIREGFLRARPVTAEHRELLRKGAVYWAKIHDYGVKNVPVGFDPNLRGEIYYGRRGSKASTLGMRAPGEAHRGFPSYDWPGRRLDRRPPHRGRPDNPYPGKYYPGVYPP